VRKHDHDLDTEDTLAHEHVADGLLDVHVGDLTSLDHVTLLEFHTLRTLGTKLARHDNLATLGTGLHDEADDRVGGTADGKTLDELVLERFGLGIGAETALVDGLSEKGELVLLVAEALLDDGGELLDALEVLADNFLGVGGADDDLSADGGDAHFDTGVTELAELLGEELVQFSVEDAIGDELALLTVATKPPKQNTAQKASNGRTNTQQK